MTKRIAIVGAGAAGLSAAVRLRDRGYDDVTVFEGAQQVGGKACSVEVDGRDYDLGAVVITPQYPNVLALADRYRVPTFPRSEAVLAVDLKSADWMGLEQMTRSMHPSREYLSAVIRALRYVKRHRKFFDTPGFSFNHCPELGWLRTELALPFSEWAVRHRLTPLTTMWEPSTVDMGYGPYRDVSALYLLHYMLCIPRGSIYSVMLRRLRKGGLGFRSFTYGAQSLFEAVAKEHRVYTGVAVTGIKRATDSWQLLTANDRSLGYFDAVALALPLDNALQLLEPPNDGTRAATAIADMKLEVGRELQYTDYYATIAEARGLPDTAAGYFSFNSQGLGLRGGHSGSRPWAESPLWVFYHYGSAEQPGSSDAAVDLLRSDLRKVGVQLQSVVTTKAWPNYFPRVSQSAIRDGFYDRMDGIQGKGLFYLGGALGFEILKQTVTYSYWLVDKHFPEVSGSLLR